MTVHSSVLAWRIPWTMGSQRVGKDWVTNTTTIAEAYGSLMISEDTGCDAKGKGKSLKGFTQGITRSHVWCWRK